MFNKFLIFLLIHLIVFPSFIFARVSTSEKAELGAINNLVENSGFESGLGGWTASGGTFTLDSSTPISGKNSALWDSNALSQTLKGTLKTIDPKIALKLCEGTFYYKYPSGSANDYKFEVHNGSSEVLAVNDSDLEPINVTSDTDSITLIYSCPAEGVQVQPVITSLVADAGTIELEDFYIEKYRSGGTTKGNWQYESSELGQQDFDVIGFGDTTTANDGLTRAVLVPYVSQNGAWRLRFNIIGQFDTETTNQTIAITGVDLKDTINQAITWSHPGSSANLIKALAAGVSNSIFASVISNEDDAYFSGDVELESKPTWATKTPNETFKFDTLAKAYAGYHGIDCLWTGSFSGSFGEPADDASCTYTQRKNVNFGTVTSYGNKKPGITFVPNRTSTAFVCGNITLKNSAAGSANSVRITDGTTVVAEKTQNVQVANNKINYNICGLYDYHAGVTANLYFEFQASSGAMSIGDTFSPGIEWTIFPITESKPAPAIWDNNTVEVSSSPHNWDLRYDKARVTTGASNVVVNLPSASSVRKNKVIEVVKVDSGDGFVELNPSGSETVRGSTTSIYAIVEGESIRLQSDGSNWKLLGNPLRQVSALLTPASGTGTGNYSITDLYNSGSWLQSITHGSLGNSSLAIKTGVFYTTPSLVVSASVYHSGNYLCEGAFTPTTSPTAASVFCIDLNTLAAANERYTAILSGRK